MQYFTELVALAVGASALAIPNNLKRWALGSVIDNFDDLPANTLVPELSPVGVYHDLSYGGAVVYRPVLLSALAPHSATQYAGGHIVTDLLYLGSLTLNGYITLKPANKIQKFDLESFYFGFGTNTATTIGLSENATLYVVGYDQNDGAHLALFSYTSGGDIQSPLTFAQLPDGFKELKNATFGVSSDQPLAALSYLALDDVKHNNYVL